MSADQPAYYSALGPFREVFESGNPILTYHKLSPRSHRCALGSKGMYLGARLFSRQLEEALRAAGFSNGSLGTDTAGSANKRVVITFDDGYVNVLRHGIEPLAKNGFRAIQFLVAGLIGKRNEWDIAAGEAPEPMMDVGQVREWLAAGHDIGSHTLSHPWLTRLPRTQAQEEITASRKKLEDLFGRPIRHFCYPYGDWNNSVRDLVEAAGYATACTTNAGINAARRFALRV